MAERVREIFVEDPPISSGNEHDVHHELDGATETDHPWLSRQPWLIKVPNGRFFGWQTQNPWHAIDDLNALEAYGMPMPETEVIHGINRAINLVRAREGQDLWHITQLHDSIGSNSYVLRQALIEGARTVTLRDLGVPEIRDQVEYIVLQSIKLHADERLCADLLGGECLWSILSTNPQGLVSNLLLDQDGKVWLCDTRTFRLPVFYKQSQLKGKFYEGLWEFEMEALLTGIRHQSPDRAGTEIANAWEASALPRVAARLGFKAGIAWINAAGKDTPEIESKGGYLAD